ncbi:MAG: type VI secretion system baseplate subunit TssF [Campylobacter sp.]|nr:type VI secretion system baseplate subunit TssF [Campylobacter sp.]
MAYLYEMRELFVEKFPKIAPFLGVDNKDPDVERIIENVAILTSKIHQELDENIPLIAESLINIVSPNYTNPIPSSCVQEFLLKNDSSKNSLVIPKNSTVISKPIRDVKCKFKTIYDVYLYPLKISKTYLSNNKNDYILNLELNITKDDISLADLDMTQLNLYLGNDVYMSATLVMWMKMYLKKLVVFCPDSNEEFHLPLQSIDAMGLDDKLIEYDGFGFEAFSLLQELFFAPYKFNFISIKNLDILKNSSSKNFNIKFIFDRDLPSGYIPRTEYFSLFATPIINLFEMSAEPILNNNKRNGYRIFMDRAKIDAYEIVQVSKVIAHSSDTGRRILKNYKSFERFNFFEGNDVGDFYSLRDRLDANSNTYKEISFFSNSDKDQTVTVETLCCNGNLPSGLKISDINNLQDRQDIATKNITVPTAVHKVNIDGNLLWKLVSILSFSYQTILDKKSFLAVLDAFTFDRDNVSSQTIANSIQDIKTKPIYRIDEQIVKKGILCIFYIDESKFYSIGEVYITGLVLSKFLSSFASINSFCELKIKCVQSKVVMDYPLFSGNKALI